MTNTLAGFQQPVEGNLALTHSVKLKPQLKEDIQTPHQHVALFYISCQPILSERHIIVGLLCIRQNARASLSLSFLNEILLTVASYNATACWGGFPFPYQESINTSFPAKNHYTNSILLKGVD